MSKEVLILSPESTQGRGGLADYALHVVEEWGDSARAHFIASTDELPARDGRVLLHYSAYGFNRFGYPRKFLRALINWRRQERGRLVVMLHEIWTFWPVLNKNYFVQWLHRSDLRELISVADFVFTSTPSQAEHILKLIPAKAIQVLPVGANIRPRASTIAREDGTAVLFGLSGSRLHALRRMRADLQSLAAAKVIRKLITIGPGDGERALLEELPLAENFEMRGALPATEVSNVLARASFALSAQDELSVYKSGTFMSYAAHGLNIISPYADPFAPEPICWLTRAEELIRGVAPNELLTRAQNLKSWQERTSSWPHIAQQFAEALGI